MKTALIAMAVLAAVDARMGFGKCPDVNYMTGFDQNRFIG